MSEYSFTQVTWFGNYKDSKFLTLVAAKARLNDAAPDLLEALQNLLSVMGGGSKDEWDEVIAARAAIAKALGQLEKRDE